jgi:hypothetical protein
MSTHRLPGRLAVLLACGLSLSGAVSPGSAQVPEYTLVPTVRIGSLDDPGTALSLVTGLAVAPDGRVAVMQPEESSVWIFSPSGERLGELGREGAGPGEFRSVSMIGWRGDTLWVADGQLHRVTFFVPGQAAPVIAGGAERRAEPYTRVPLPGADGRWLLFRQWMLDPELRQYRQEIWSADGEWQPVSKLAELPDGPDMLPATVRGLVGGWGEQPFAEHPLHVIAPDVSSVTTVRRDLGRASSGAGRYTVTRVGMTGDTVFHGTHPVRLEPLTRQTRDAVVESFLSPETVQRAGSSPAALRRDVLAGVRFPDYHPPVSRAVVGVDGTTWLRGPDRRDGAVRWTVLDGAGAPVRAVITDRELGTFGGGRLPIMAPREGGVWVVVHDEFDVPYVVGYELRRRAGGGARR